MNQTEPRGIRKRHRDKGIKKIYFENLAILAAKAREKGIPFQLTILSAGHRSGSDTYVTPTAEQLRWQMDIGLTFGANNLAHYIYTSHEDSYSTMVDYNTGATTELYNDVMQVDQEHMAWADIYAKYEWQGVAKVDADAENPMISRTPTGIYFRGAENDAPFKEDWTALYSPVDSACVKLIRDGVVYEIGIPGRGTIVKFGSTEFYLKTETWNLGDFMPLQEGDVLVLEPLLFQRRTCSGGNGG